MAAPNASIHLPEAAVGCDPVQVTGYVDGELPKTLAARTRRHLSICGTCSAQASFEIGLSGVLRSLPGPLFGPWSRPVATAARASSVLQ